MLFCSPSPSSPPLKGGDVRYPAVSAAGLFIERGILPFEIMDALVNCSVVEDYPNDKRGHSCLVWGKSKKGKDLHMVCGLTDKEIWVITIYEPDSIRWDTPQKRRSVK